MKHLAKWLVAVVVAACVCWLFPLFHVVPLKTATAEKAAATFNATQFAANFWTNRLLASLDKTVKAEMLLPAIQSDPASAKQKFSRSVGDQARPTDSVAAGRFTVSPSAPS